VPARLSATGEPAAIACPLPASEAVTLNVPEFPIVTAWGAELRVFARLAGSVQTTVNEATPDWTDAGNARVLTAKPELLARAGSEITWAPPAGCSTDIQEKPVAAVLVIVKIPPGRATPATDETATPAWEPIVRVCERELTLIAGFAGSLQTTTSDAEPGFSDAGSWIESVAEPELSARAGAELSALPPDGESVATQDNPAIVALVTVNVLPAVIVDGKGATLTAMAARVTTMTDWTAEVALTEGFTGSLQDTVKDAGPGRRSDDSATTLVAFPEESAVTGCEVKGDAPSGSRRSSQTKPARLMLVTDSGPPATTGLLTAAMITARAAGFTMLTATGDDEASAAGLEGSLHVTTIEPSPGWVAKGSEMLLTADPIAEAVDAAETSAVPVEGVKAAVQE
jgi:hypothetical protein